LLVNGFIAGSIYALVAVGYTLIYGILKFINFAHGEIFMLGAYGAFFLVVRCKINIFIAFPLTMFLVALAGVIIERLAYRPLRNASRLVTLLSAIGISICLQNIVALFFGNEMRSIRQGIIKPGWNVLGATITQNQVVIFAAACLQMVFLHLFLMRTKFGKAIRATAEDLKSAEILGINIDEVIAVTFALSSALAAVAGILVSFEQDMVPTMGIMTGLKAFTAAVVGGIGNVPGAMLGGIAIGLIENLGIAVIPSGYKDLIAFSILILMLMFRPIGLFGNLRERQL